MAKSTSGNQKLVSPRKKTTHNKHRLGGTTKKSTKDQTTKKSTKDQTAKHVIIPPRLENWKLIQTIGEKQSDLVVIMNSKAWDFSHLRAGLLSFLQQFNDGSKFFVFGSQPHNYLEDGKAKFVPTFSVIRVPPTMAGSNHPMAPPPFVSMQNPQQGSDEIITNATYKLQWVPFSDIGEGRVFGLQRFGGILTRRSELEFEYLQLYSMIPSKVCPRKADGVIDIQTAEFTYTVNGEEIVEQYTKGEDSFADFCDRYDLDEEEHKPKVKAAVKEGFNKAREKLESRLELLQSTGYSEASLESIRIVAKFYPRNEDLNGLVVRSPYVNQYYGAAAQIL